MRTQKHKPSPFLSKKACSAFFSALAVSILGCGKSPSSKPTPLVPAVVSADTAVSREVGGIRFESVAAERGIAYVYPKQARPMRNLEAFGCGCAFFDYDNDGWQDVLLVTAPHPVLYHNDNGHFTDVSEASGLNHITGDWKGCAISDIDGDGRLDILFTGYHCLALVRNLGGGHFADVTQKAGLDPHNGWHWGASAGFMDLAGKGRLDVVLTNYVIFSPKEQQYCELRPGIRSGCPPSYYRGEIGEVWANIGNGHFHRTPAEWGMKKTNGKGLVLAFADINDDGRMDFYIGNDGTPAELMQNEGNLHFKNIGRESGTAFGGMNHAIASMGAAWGDFDRDGRLDLATSAFSDESYSLFRNRGQGLFELVSDTTGLSGPTSKPLGFGVNWLDMDNDGWLDLFFANGHVYDNVADIDPLSTFQQPIMLFHNEEGRVFSDLVPQMSGSVAAPLLGRGSAVGDFDNDGRQDLLIVDYEGAPVLLHNISTTPGHWLTLDLRRATGANRFAYGAQVWATAGKTVWTALVSPASSYLSSSDPRLHIGLGAMSRIDRIAIRWPDGKREELKNVEVDRLLTVVQGQGIVPAPTPTPSSVTPPAH